MQDKTRGFLIQGTVVSRDTRQPLPNLIVEALDKDLLFDDRLGSATTDQDGYFELHYERGDFQELFMDLKPDIYLRIRRADGSVILTTEDKVRYEAGRTETFNIMIPVMEHVKGETKVKNTIKLVLDLSEIKADPELGPELLKEKKPLKVAAVRQGAILAETEVNLEKIEDYSAVAVELEFKTEGKLPSGAYVVVGPNLPDREFLEVETRKLWLSPRRFTDGVANLSRERLIIPKHLYRRWLWLCRTFTISGTVIKRVDGCDETVPGATVEAYDVDCWWFWWRRDLIDSAVTNPDGTFEMTFRWCCVFPFPILKPFYPRPPWILNPDLLKKFREVIVPEIGPIPPEALRDPSDFELFVEKRLGTEPGPVDPMPTPLLKSVRPPVPTMRRAAPTLPLPPPRMRVDLPSLSKPIRLLVDKLRPVLPRLPCWPIWPRDCTPDIVFKVTQECDEEVRVIYDENPFQTRWNITSPLTVTLFAEEEACSIGECEEPPLGANCLKFTKVNCIDVDDIGVSAGPPDLRGYANPGDQDNPFTGVVRMRGLLGAGSDIDYIRPEYDFNHSASFSPVPKENLVAFSRKYWAPPPGALPGTPAKWNSVLFKPHEVDGEIVYKTLKLAEDENPLPGGWTWGYLWNDFSSLFLWNPDNFEGDGVYTLQLRGYRWTGTGLDDQGVLETCEFSPSDPEQVMVRADNRLADDPAYPVSADRPCGAGTIHLCTHEPDCDLVSIDLINSSGTTQVEPCDIIQLGDTDQIVIHFQASDQDGHLAGYHMHAHWGENRVFNVITDGELDADSDTLVGPLYANTFASIPGPGPHLNDRDDLPATHLDKIRPMWHGGNFKVSLLGSNFEASCAYTLKLRVWKRCIRHCNNEYHVHVNWCSYSFTIEKV